jgi:hypothetical protein
MVCDNCGKKMKADWSYCLHCGGRPVPDEEIKHDEPKARAFIPLSFWLTAIAVFLVIGAAVMGIIFLSGKNGFLSVHSFVQDGVMDDTLTSAPAITSLQAEGFREDYWAQIPISIPAFHFGTFDKDQSERTDIKGFVFYNLRYEGVTTQEMDAYADELEAEGFYISYMKDKENYSIQGTDLGMIESGPSVYADLNLQDGTCTIFITIAISNGETIVYAGTPPVLS